MYVLFKYPFTTEKQYPCTICMFCFNILAQQKNTASSATTKRQTINEYVKNKDFYIWKRKVYDYQYHLFDIANSPALQKESLGKFKELLGKQGSALQQLQHQVVKFVRYCMQLPRTSASPNKPLYATISHKDWSNIGQQCHKIVHNTFEKMRNNPHWARRAFYVSIIVDRSPTKRLNLKYNFKHIRDEYKIKIPVGQVFMLKIMNVSFMTLSRVNSLKKSTLDTWKIWTKILWVTMTAPSLIQQFRHMIQQHIDSL